MRHIKIKDLSYMDNTGSIPHYIKSEDAVFMVRPSQKAQPAGRDDYMLVSGEFNYGGFKTKVYLNKWVDFIPYIANIIERNVIINNYEPL